MLLNVLRGKEGFVGLHRAGGERSRRVELQKEVVKGSKKGRGLVRGPPLLGRCLGRRKGKERLARKGQLELLSEDITSLQKRKGDPGEQLGRDTCALDLKGPNGRLYGCQGIFAKL